MQDTTSATTQEREVFQVSETYSNYTDGPFRLKRNEFGLLKNISYKFTPEGWVDWRAMVDPKFLYPNKDWFEARGETVPESIESLEDAQLLIQLGGIKELARLRGFLGVSYELTHVSEKNVAAQCTIDWIPNYENPNGVRFESTANATTENTNGFGAKFLEAIAENRAFVRAVRNFLNIHIVGADEMDKSKNKVAEIEETAQTVVSLTAQSSLEKQAVSAGYKTFSDFSENILKKYLLDHKNLETKAKLFGLKTYEDFRTKFLNPLAKQGKYSPKTKPQTPWLSFLDIPEEEKEVISSLFEENKEWKTYAEIPADECRKIISLIKKNK